MAIDGETEHDFPSGGTEQYCVEIIVPADAPAGDYVFRLDMVGVQNPDELYAQGPSVTFYVPEVETQPANFPWWILAVVGAAIASGTLAFVFGHET